MKASKPKFTEVQLDEENPEAFRNDAKNNNNNNQLSTETSVELPSFGKILQLARPEYFTLFISLLLMCIAEASSFVNPLLIADAYDIYVDFSLSSSTKMSKINRLMGIVIAIQCTGIFTSFLRVAIMNAVGERVVARLRLNLYSHILKQEIAFFDGRKTGELVSRLGSDTTLVQQATSNAVPEVVVGVVKVVVCIAIMFWISPVLAGMTLALTAAISMICVPFGIKIGKLSRMYQDALGKAQNSSTEAFGAVRTVQAFAAEMKEAEKYASDIGSPGSSFWLPEKDKWATTYGVGLLKSVWNSAFFTVLFGFGFGMLNASLWFGFKLVVDGHLTLGKLTAFQSYIFLVGTGLGNTSRFISQLFEAKGASARIFQLLERVPVIPSPISSSNGDENADGNEKKDPSGSIPSSMIGNIELKNVSFAYPSRPDVPVLQNFQLFIPAESTVALVGASGSGKSTVVSLLQRFYDIQNGSILYDGNDIKSLNLPWLRRQIGYVQQEPQMFGLTVRQNVVYGIQEIEGKEKVTQQEIEEACKAANAHDFIVNSLGDGYDTLVGERGVKLSGGQKQRIAIARALLVKPRILLLDEATSALDAESEHMVQEAIDNAVVGRTVIIVAHRLSTVKEADQIVVLDESRIVDVGKHDELFVRCERYKNLIKRQSVLVDS